MVLSGIQGGGSINRLLHVTNLCTYSSWETIWCPNKRFTAYKQLGLLNLIAKSATRGSGTMELCNLATI